MPYIKEFYRFLKHIFQSKELLFTLIKNDFKKEYLGSYLGLAWAYIQPLAFMLVIWFVFEIGFRAAPPSGDTPFALWLLSGMIPWFFVSNAVIAGTNSIVTNAFLVKKVAFRVSILPLVQIGSTLLVHLGLLLFLIVMFILSGKAPSIYWLQIPYYMLCATILALGISWLTSSIRVFVKDIGSFIGVLVQIGFWATPIFWSISSIPEQYRYIVQLNPAFYIVDGYRNVFVNHIWFWEQPKVTIYFLLTTALFFVLGAIVFKRLRPHFGDVL